MKTIGLIMLSASIICSAIVRMKIYRKRLTDLHDAIRFLQGIKRSLSVEPVPMQEMFMCMTERSSGTEKIFYGKISEDLNKLGEKSFYDIWCDNIKKFFPDLLGIEKHEMNNLGNVLGICPVDMQINYVGNCEESFVKTLQMDKAQYPQRKKLCFGLSASAAAAVIIVFI